MPRGKRTRAETPTHSETPVPMPTAITPVTSVPKKELVLEGDPEAQLAFASKAANALMGIVSRKPEKVVIQGKQYLEYGDWQVLGRFYGATVEIEWTKPIEVQGRAQTWGYEARALVRRNGEIISSAEGMCTRDERRWRSADDYAIRSMAQTRTAAKALRNAFGWVAELAGYSATPAEEMPRERFGTASVTEIQYDEGEQASTGAPSVSVDDEQPPKPWKSIIAGQLGRLGHDVTKMTKKEADAAVLKLTGLDMVPEDYEEISTRLSVLLRERDNGA